MDEHTVKEAVKDKENYASIVVWFRSLTPLTIEQLVLLVDTIGEMSEEIFEHYKALCDLCRGELQRIRRICGEEGMKEAFPDDAMRSQLAYVIKRACDSGIVLKEKYEDMVKE